MFNLFYLCGGSVGCVCAVLVKVHATCRLFNFFQIKQHQDTKQHKAKTELKRTSGALQKFLTPASTSRPVSENDNVTAAELTLSFHTVKHNLSYNSMDCSVKLNKIIYADSKTATNIKLARTKMEALVMEVLGPHALESVVNDLKDENMYFCLQTDASNKKNIKLFPLVVQYFTVEKGIQNKLLDFYENANESADGMFAAIKKSMDMYNIPFNRVSGLSADNTNSNFGVHHSLYTNMVDVVPDIVKGNCHAHIVHNCVEHGMGFLTYDVENVILKIYSHFSVSACRREELKMFVAIVEGDFHELKRHIGTRWLSLLPCIDTILLNWHPICDYFKSLDEDCPMIIQNLLMLDCNHDLIEIYLHFASHILNIFHKTIKSLEGNSVTIVDVFGLMENLKSELLQRQKDNYFGYTTKQKLKPLEQSSPDLFYQINTNFSLCIDKCLTYLQKWFDFSSDNWLYSLNTISLKTNVEFNHLEQIIEGKLNLQRLNIHMDSLYSEVIILKELQAELFNNTDFMQKSTAEKWQFIFKKCPEEFDCLKKMISYILSVPATSAFTERVFSVMNVKWREERNRASLKLIKNELLIYINLELECLDSYNFFKNNEKLLCAAKSTKKYLFKSTK